MDLSLERFDLFTVPGWRCSFGWIEPRQQELLDDIDRMLDASTLEAGYPGRQTRPVLQELPGTAWEQLFNGIVAVCDGVLASEPGRFAAPDASFKGLRSWALELHAPYDHGASRHSHAGATFSSVLWVEVPVPHERAGTTFHDPLGFLQPAQSSATRHDVHAAPWDLIVFPWWVEHHPTPLPDSSGRRIVVATDLVYL